MVMVVMLEKGKFTPAAELAPTEQEGFSIMYEVGGLLTTQDAGARFCPHALCPGLAVLCSRLVCSASGPETTKTSLSLESHVHVGSASHPWASLPPKSMPKHLAPQD